MDTHEKLVALADDSRYDLACACGTDKDDRRKRNSTGDKWLYPASLPNGGKSILFKTLMSNHCSSDCKYCPLRDAVDSPRCTLSPTELAKVCMDYYRRRKIIGMFLSSSIISTPDRTMDRLIETASILRNRYQFRGYIHMKIIPGCSSEAIEKIVSLSSAVSLNVEVPTAAAMSKLSARKDFLNDIVAPVKLISRLTARGSRYKSVKQTTQFIVGASDESDRQIITATNRLYKNLNLSRVYYSSYQSGGGDSNLPGESAGSLNQAQRMTREHRLYQSDFLMRKYGFIGDEIPCDQSGQLSLDVDPKQAWADAHMDIFPLDVNKADKIELLRVPGLGPLTVNRILKYRRKGGRLPHLSRVGLKGKLLEKASKYVKV